MKIAKSFYILLLVLSFHACNDDALVSDVSVYTEEVVYTSGEQVVMTGRILALGKIAIEDHGFQIDSTENFSDPIIISLGEKNIPGRFVGQSDQLDLRVGYYCRSFITSEGITTFGNVLSFSTKSPGVIGFSPKEGNSNVQMVIEGRNLTADTKVIWNDKVIIPDAIIAETYVEFRAPPIDDTPFGYMKLVSKGDTLVLDEPFEYIIGVWTEEGELGDTRHNVRHIYFEDGDDFIYGLGVIQVDISNEIVVMDKASFQKTFLTFPGTATEGAFYADTYFGGGSANRVVAASQALNLSKDFWKYENLGFVQLADMPVELYMATALRSGDKLFVYGGERANRLINLSIYVYDILSNTWSTQSYSPVHILNSYPAFNIDDYHYFITADGSMHRYHFSSGTWDKVAKFPVAPKENGISIILNGEAYVGQQGTERSLFVYRPLSNIWRTKRNLSTNDFYFTMGAWADDNKIYISRSNSTNSTIRKLWSHDPYSF